MSALSDLTIANARRYVTGASLETFGNNDGPEIRDWLARRGIHHPAPYCAAGACAWIEDAAAALQITLKLRRSAGGLHLLDTNPELVITFPEVGCLVIWDHGGGLSHVGVCAGITVVGGELASIQVIGANTNADGARDANQVVERDFPFPQSHPIAGYLRVA